jgi:rfaE bifunctional protein kinase chain/domain
MYVLIFGLMEHNGIHFDSVIRIDSPTIVKTRIISNGQQLLRYDIEKYIKEDYSQKIIDALSCLGSNFDAVIISDYYKGMISKKITDFVRVFYSCPIFVDPKPLNKELYRDFYCITPNLHELIQMTSSSDITVAAKQLKKELNLNCIVVTLSENGVFLLDQNDASYSFCAHKLSSTQAKHSKSDVTGAGDTLMSVFVLAICSGYDYIASLKIANIAAAIVVNQLGTVTCQKEELEREIACLENGSLILQN